MGADALDLAVGRVSIGDFFILRYLYKCNNVHEQKVSDVFSSSAVNAGCIKTEITLPKYEVCRLNSKPINRLQLFPVSQTKQVSSLHGQWVKQSFVFFDIRAL